MHTDLDLAIQRLKEKNLSLVITKKGRVLFETEAHGVYGLLDSIKKLGNRMIGSSVADKIVGRAAALLLAYSRVAAVFAATTSDGGVEVLANYKILYEFENLVPRILNTKKTDVCPFEKIAEKLSEPKEAYVELSTKCASKQGL